MKKRILIAGGTGLVGSYLIDELLLNKGYEIHILGRNKKDKWQAEQIKYIEINLQDDWDESELPEDIYAIIHLSQAENYRKFPENAKEVFYINTLSTLKLINYAVQKKVTHFIYASSGGVYGNLDEAFKENSVITFERRTDFYITTKHCSEVILENYFENINVVIMRFFFVYGNGQRQEMLIPRLINSVKTGTPIILQGKEGIKINPIYAGDAALAILEALKLNYSQIINIGGPEVLTLKEIGDSIADSLGISAKYSYNESENPNNIIGDISRMKEILCTPQTRFKEVIKTLVYK